VPALVSPKSRWVGFRFTQEDEAALQSLCSALGRSLPGGVAVNRTQALRYAIRMALGLQDGKRRRK